MTMNNNNNPQQRIINHNPEFRLNNLSLKKLILHQLFLNNLILTISSLNINDS